MVVPANVVINPFMGTLSAGCADILPPFAVVGWRGRTNTIGADDGRQPSINGNGVSSDHNFVNRLQFSKFIVKLVANCFLNFIQIADTFSNGHTT